MFTKIINHMCFEVDHNHPTVKVATRPILVWKRLQPMYESKRWVSPYRLEQYVEGELKTATLGQVDRSNPFVGQIEEGLHCYSRLDRAQLRAWSCETVHEMIIPTGTKYWISNKSNEIVCEALLFEPHNIPTSTKISKSIKSWWNDLMTKLK